MIDATERLPNDENKRSSTHKNLIVKNTEMTVVVIELVLKEWHSLSTIYRTIKYKKRRQVTPPKQTSGRHSLSADYDETIKNVIRQLIHRNNSIPFESVVFQQDNDSKHACKLCDTWKQTDPSKLWNGFWKACLNPIELLWEQLDREVQKTVQASEADSWKKLQKAWVRIIPDTLMKGN
ncbi:hypothetical protein Trydic_g6518 [Trypoxylus dichotomus]